eukprot:211573_1
MSSESTEQPTMKEYLVLFYHFDRHGYVDFRLEEFASLCSLYGHDTPFPNQITQHHKQNNLHDPFMTVQLPNDTIAHQICKRSMLTKAIYDVLIEGETVNEIILKLKKYDVTSNLSKYLNQSHRIRNIYFGKKCSHAENLHNIRLLDGPFLSFMTGPIDLHSAQVEYHLVADYGDHTHLGMDKPRDTPQRVYLCRYVAGSNRDIIRQFSLKKRKYVGSTSLDSELSFLMANQCKIRDGSIVLDPFCGTGSLLISCTYFGGFVFGGDIDMRVLRGNKYFQHGIQKTDHKYRHKTTFIEEEEIVKNTEDHSIYANFKHYGLQRPELMRCDLNNIAFKAYSDMGMKFDAILCDPPYGLRAGARKCGHKNPIKIPEKYHDNHHPRTQMYDQKDIMYDLLQFVAKYLSMNGRFVYLLPATIDFDETKDLPTHPALRIIGNSEQKCQGIFRRRLITMEKHKEFEHDMVPFIPPKPDFADMKNKIFFKQHSHHAHNTKHNGTKRIKGKKKNKKKNDPHSTEKRKDSPTMTEIVNPKEGKRQKVCVMNEDRDNADSDLRSNDNVNNEQK